MKLSILIPMFNASKYIERCLDSICHQNIDNEEFEVLIINDGSTDNCPEIVENFIKSKPNISLVNQTNSGADITRNRLLELARGEFVYFLDADDYIAYNSLSDLLNLAYENQLDVIGFGSLLTDSSEVNMLDPVKKTSETTGTVSGVEFLRAHPEHRTEIWWYLVRRQFLIEQGVVFEEVKGNGVGDFVFTMRILLNAKKMSFLDWPIHRYIQTEDSIIRSNTKERKEALIANLFAMNCCFDDLVVEYVNRQEVVEQSVVDYLKARRGTMVFYLIHQMLLKKLPISKLKYYIKELKNRNLYPVKDSIPKLLGEGNMSLKQRVLEFVVLKENLLYLSSFLYHFR